MGWQARLKKEDKQEFIRTCNKCGGTGVRKTFVSVAGLPTREEAKCSCVKKKDAEIDALAAKGKALLDELRAREDREISIDLKSPEELNGYSGLQG